MTRPGSGFVGGTENIDHADFGGFPGDDEGVGKDGSIAGDPVMDFDGAVDFGMIRDMNEQTVPHGGFVKGRVFRGAETGLLLHEMLLDEVGVLFQGLAKREADDIVREGGIGRK